MEKKYKIEGMHCTGCAKNIEDNVGDISGVSEAKIDFDTKTLTVKGNIEHKKIQEVIEDLGYEVDSSN